MSGRGSVKEISTKPRNTRKNKGRQARASGLSPSARYLHQKDTDGRYIPTVRIQVPGRDGASEVHLIIDRQGRTYRDLNRALEMDFWLLNRWKAKHAPNLQVVIES